MTSLTDLYESWGQSPWIDNIRRDWLNDGTLRALVTQGVRGVTSNPAIFAKAFATSTAYDELVARADESDPEALFEDLAVADVRDACDVLMDVHHRAHAAFVRGERRHGDGFVSLEVSPRLAHDTDGTVEAAKRLWQRVDRSNVMIKIPATRAGLPAITRVLGEGINVNVTLIFSVERYEEVLEAWHAGLALALANGHDVAPLASVASFFVSRVDAAVDAQLPSSSPLRGRIANAQVARAYQAYRRFVEHDAVRQLLSRGAQVQRPLWASTSTKNPEYDDLLYVDYIVADETVNTMPDATLTSTLEHGDFSRSLLVNDATLEATAALISQLPEEVSLATITEKLEADGVASFISSYDELLDTVRGKMNQGQ